MDEETKRIPVTLTNDDVARLEELKGIFNQKTYSKVIQILIRYSK